MHQKYESCLEKEFVKHFPFQNFCEILLKQLQTQCFIKCFKVGAWGIKFLKRQRILDAFLFSIPFTFFFFLNIPQKCVSPFSKLCWYRYGRVLDFRNICSHSIVSMLLHCCYTRELNNKVLKSFYLHLPFGDLKVNLFFTNSVMFNLLCG